VGFFDDRPRDPIGEQSRRGLVFADSPTRDYLPGLVTSRLVVFRTEASALVFDRFEVYRDRVGLRCNLQTRDPDDLPIDEIPFHEAYEWWAGHDPPGDFLRLGVVFSDGSAWSNIDRVRSRTFPQSTPRFHFSGGGGGGGSWTMEAWIEPLPPEGPLTFIAEWPARGIAEARATMDAGRLRQAAAHIEEFWPR
jgi:hypothetical protein